MPIELLAGESKELNVAMQPIGGPAIPLIQNLYMVDNPKPDTTAEFVIFCPIKNMGTAPGTFTATCYTLLYDVFPKPQLKKYTKTFTIGPGETYMLRYYSNWGTGARGEIWVVGDWGEETPKMFCTFGYHYGVKDSAELKCTRAGANHATLRFAQPSLCNDWEFLYYTPYVQPFEHGGKFRFKAPKDPVSSAWSCIHSTVWGLLSGRNYEAYCLGGAPGAAWREDWTRFTTL